ncbi:MAG: cytochrome C [Blastocatellia bacterium]|nr:MAG: cytochrome C [Blastocatellia bacterium]
MAWRSPGNNQGYEPIQPIAFSHKLHAGDMQISCVYCHLGAETSRYAGIPAVSTCMNCHKTVTASAAQQRARAAESPELRKLYDALALDKKLAPVPGAIPKPIAWQRVHQLPDFVYFDHRGHVSAGVGCQNCHGPVDSMDRVRQVETLAMGWCVNCHRAANISGVAGKPVYASTDCVTCHY